MLTIGSLFAGIGGLELGLERAGLGPVLWQAEVEPWCRRVLEHHWPEAERIPDVRYVRADRVPVPDLVCGGFPCQDISLAGTGAGLDGERSGLWFEFARVVADLRPRFVVVENVSALRRRGLGVVLGHLASCGYDATWDCVPAAAVGAPHQRDRLFVVAWRVSDAVGDPLRDLAERGVGRARSPGDEGDALALDVGGGGRTDRGAEGSGVADADARGPRSGRGLPAGQPDAPEGGEDVADADRAERHGRVGDRDPAGEPGPPDEREEVGDPAGARSPGRGGDELALRLARARRAAVAHADLWRRSAERVAGRELVDEGASGDEPHGRDLPRWPPGPADLSAWRRVPRSAQPALCPLADGLPPDLVRPALRATGNAVVVPVGEVIGRVVRGLLDEGAA